ncbi:MAG: type II secretion system protein [Bdellovibrionales bacterium]|jgi:prepilin-type N-terminal cleavage/methylation domain-containing protein
MTTLNRIHRKAFTLAEMSMVLVIIGLVIMIVFPALTTFRQTMQVSATQSNLQALMRASAAFVQANGCLPCPTPAATTGAGFGRVRGDTVTSSCGTCSVAEGIVPFVSLGVPTQTAKDGWGRWITMRVDPALTINFGVVPPTALCMAGDTTPLCVTGESRKGLCQANLPSSNRIAVATVGGGTQQAAILFLSHGANGWGAFKADPLISAGLNDHLFKGALTPCSATGGFERCNANSDLAYVEAPFSNDPAAPYDDVMVYAGRDALVTALGNPACQTTW